MPIKTQGTHLYLVDRTVAASPKLVKFSCPTGITGIGSGGTDEIDTTCLDAVSNKTFELGLSDPGSVSVPFILESKDASHRFMFASAKTKSNVEVIICLSDGTAEPTIGATDPKKVVPPTDRSYLMFVAGVKTPQLDIAGNEVIRGTMELRLSGDVTRGGPVFDEPTP